MHASMFFSMGGALLLGSAALTGCGNTVMEGNPGGGGEAGQSPTGGGSTSTSDGGGGAASTSTTDTPSTSETTTTTNPGHALAIHQLRVGTTTPEGIPNAGAWKLYGFDIDGKVSTSASSDLCMPALGASKNSVYPDGDGGIDNSFGRHVVPIFAALSPSFEAELNAAIHQGAFTSLTRIAGIQPGQTGTFLAQVYSGTYDGPAAAPAWSGTDLWQIAGDSLVGGDLATPKAQYPASEVTVDASGARVWQSNGTTDFTFVLHVSGLPVRVVVHHARMRMVLSDDNLHATSGHIGGVIDTQEFIAELAKMAGAFDEALCPPSATFQSIAQQIEQAQDILLDGSQNPSVTCNGISIGLGFEADAAGLGAVFDPPQPLDPCAP